MNCRGWLHESNRREGRSLIAGEVPILGASNINLSVDSYLLSITTRVERIKEGLWVESELCPISLGVKYTQCYANCAREARSQSYRLQD